MRVLVTHGSKRGGTEGIARTLADGLGAEGADVTFAPARRAPRPDGYDAVVVGGALYANRWHRDARRFVARHERALRAVPLWLFSSGPLDESAEDPHAIAPVAEVAAIMERVGAQGHATFGGRLTPDARGFPASAMARTRAGDWRRPERIRAWATELARALPTARPRPVVAQPGHAIGRVVSHGVAGWAACAAVMLALVRLANLPAALVVHAIVAPILFALVAAHYFRARGARAPLVVAASFAAIVLALDLALVAPLAAGFAAMLGSVAGFWLPLALVFAVTWATGAIRAMMPMIKANPPARARPAAHA